MTASRSIPVVCAIVEDNDGRVLIAQRPPHKHQANQWEFAGGKVESGEQPAAALAREIREELGCDIAIVRALPRYTHDYGDIAVEMIPFRCVLRPGSPAPHPHEHTAIRWVTISELATLPLAAADIPIAAGLLLET